MPTPDLAEDDVSEVDTAAGLKHLAQLAEVAPLLTCGNLRCPTCHGKDDNCRHGEVWLSFEYENGDWGWEIEVLLHDQRRNYSTRDKDLARVVASAVDYVDREKTSRAGVRDDQQERTALVTTEGGPSNPLSSSVQHGQEQGGESGFPASEASSVGLHVDRYRLRWGEEPDELVERITRDQDIHCSRSALDGKPMLPWGNGYGYITDWHADGECEAHKPTYSRLVVPDGETFQLQRPLRPDSPHA